MRSLSGAAALALWWVGAAGLAAGEAVLTASSGVEIKLDKSTPLPNAPGYHLLKGTAASGGKVFPIAWGLFLPASYFLSKERFPLICTLHNVVGEVGGADGNPKLISEGLALLMVKEMKGLDGRLTGAMPANPVRIHKQAFFIGLIPQCPKEFGFDREPMNRVVVELINVMGRSLRMDQDRVFLTGYSYGGTCTWAIGTQFPERFAGIIPLSGRLAPDPAKAPELLKNVGVWEGAGDQDGEFFPAHQQMNAEFEKAKHPNHHYIVIKGGNHFCYQAIYSDPAFWKWLYAQKRPASLVVQKSQKNKDGVQGDGPSKKK